MSKKEKANSTKLYDILWGVMIAAYAVWMIFFLKFDTYPAAETGIMSLPVYIAWIIFSTAYLFLFPYFIKRMLFSDKFGNADKYFCFANLIFSCVFVTWYGFFRNPLELTASMIGLEFPWHFKMWGLFASLSVFTNTLYNYRKNGCKSKIGLICASVGAAGLYVTINVPSAGEELILNSLRCMSHWSSALVFAILGSAGLIIGLFHKAKQKNVLYTVLLVVFSAILLVMIILLVTVGKNGLIESLPMWAMYIVMIIANYTNLGDKQHTKEEKKTAVVK